MVRLAEPMMILDLRRQGLSPTVIARQLGIDHQAVRKVATDAKANEITAVPKLLEMLSLKGTIVTIDGLDGQREIPSSGCSNGFAAGTLARLAQQIVDHGSDQALALTGDQSTLYHDVVTCCDDPASATTTAKPVVEADRGRIETRTATFSTDIKWLRHDHRWPGLTAIAQAGRRRETRSKTATEAADRPLSAALSPGRGIDAVRSRGNIENRLHWVLDVTTGA